MVGRVGVGLVTEAAGWRTAFALVALLPLAGMLVMRPPSARSAAAALAGFLPGLAWQAWDRPGVTAVSAPALATAAVALRVTR